MKVDAIQRATILSRALPCIQKHNGKVVVIRYGGNVMKSETLEQNVMTDTVLLSEVGVHVVLVHGEGLEISDMLHKVGKQSHFVAGLCYADKEAMNVVQMALVGKANKDLVSLINQKGARAVGISGIDVNCIQARQYTVDEGDLSYVGEIEEIYRGLILDIIEKGYIPVVASVGCDTTGHTYSINTDTAAASTAAKLHTENMILISDIPRLLRSPEDEGSLIPGATLSEIEELKKDDVISGEIIPRVDCLVTAVQDFMQRAVIIDGRVPHSTLIEMLSEEDVGALAEE